jgi:hypothetical protein
LVEEVDRVRQLRGASTFDRDIAGKRVWRRGKRRDPVLGVGTPEATDDREPVKERDSPDAQPEEAVAQVGEQAIGG